MTKLNSFERGILAWTLISVIAAGPLAAAGRLVKAPENLIFVAIPQGTKTVTLEWDVASAVLPAREWSSANGGSIDTFSYTPDQWGVGIIDAATNTQVDQQLGELAPVLFNCPGAIPPPPHITGSKVVDVSAYTANGDTTFLVGSSSTGGTRTVTPGGSSPFFRCDGSGEGIFVDGNVTFAPVLFQFDITTPERLLTYLAPTDKDATGNPNYPSRFQRRTTDQFSGVDLGTSPQMFIRASAPGVQPGRRVWLKLVDPPDPSAYVAAVSRSQGNDNKDKDRNAQLYGSDGKRAKLSGPAPPYATLPVVVGSDRRIEVILEGSQNYAGDNYRVIASTSRPDDNGVFSCEATATCAQSPVITVWKRQYFEQAKMVTQGAFLAADIVGSADPCSVDNPCNIHLRSVNVDGTRVIRPGVQLTLMSMGPIGTSIVGAPFHENVNVDAKNSDAGVPPVRPDPLIKGAWIVRLTSRPQLNYYGNARVSRASVDAVAVHDGAGGITSFTCNPTVMKTVLQDAFIEYADAAAVDFPFVPYVGVADLTDEIFLGKRWFQHAVRGVNPVAEPYHRLLVAAKRADVKLNCNTDLGRTKRATNDEWRISFIYEYTLAGGAAGSFRNFYTLSPDEGDPRFPLACVDKTIAGLYRREASVVEQLDVAHEVVHQYGVNEPPAPGVTKGHCAQNEYTGQFICLMNQTWPGAAVDAQISVQAGRLHYLPDGVDSEYTEMRKVKEPIQ